MKMVNSSARPRRCCGVSEGTGAFGKCGGVMQANVAAQARRAWRVRLETETRPRRCLEQPGDEGIDVLISAEFRTNRQQKDLTTDRSDDTDKMRPLIPIREIRAIRGQKLPAERPGSPTPRRC